MADTTNPAGPPIIEGGENVVPPATPASTSQVMTPPEPPKPDPTNGAEPKGEKTFTSDDIERARKEEKDKLYDRLAKQDDSLKELRADLEARRKAEADAQKAAEEAKKQAEQEEMSAKELLQQKEQEWNKRFEDIENRRAESDALLEKERQFNALQSFRNQRIQEESDNVLPELIDLVSGNTEEEIEASIAELKVRTEAILDKTASVMQQQQRGMRGASVTAPPVGPTDNEPSFENVSPQDIRDMPMSEYAKYRETLMAALKGRVSEKGLYG